ncbi:Nucleoside diphosphate kinase [Cyphomyrmex costatus]|uniref:Nucleoside diphosphate kinase n=1 Tax=Cyphomyrmex costatus TaxID=456900 RepID=A0A151K2I5_9HYME|nr:Nucleoside diphosphate kinase [Cyphomyrmex costatus]
MPRWPTPITPSTSSNPGIRRTSGPLVALVLEGDEAIAVVRELNGATDGRKAAPGTIRGDFSSSNRENLVHASDSPESADREIKLWFGDSL